MNQQSSAVPCKVIGFTQEEMAVVDEVLASQGYENDLKTWILDTMQSDIEEEPQKYAGAADRVIKNISEFVKENPDTIRASVNLFGSMFERIRKRPH